MDTFLYNQPAIDEIKIAEKEVGDKHSPLVLTNTPLAVDIVDMYLYKGEDFGLLRKNGLGGSDSSSILGVNPYTTREQLIQEKARRNLTEEEKAISSKVAVRKGNDLEPLIIQKFQTYFKQPTIKPKDSYVFVEHPYLKMNFDGVTGTPEQYIPAEIKVVTATGQRHYSPEKAMFNEREGFKPLPENISQRNWSIETKAAFYGIPAYYYTQVQAEIAALNAPFGHLSVLFDKDWAFYTFHIWRDDAVISAWIVEGFKVWEKVLALRAENGQWLKPIAITGLQPEPQIAP